MRMFGAPEFVDRPEGVWQNTGADTWGEYALVLVGARTQRKQERGIYALQKPLI